MSTITFDTLKFVERLEKAGATRELASAMAEAQKESLAEVMDAQLATKSDVRDVRAEVLAVKTGLALLEAKFEARFDKLSWMMGILIALAAANFAKQFF
ncbi:MAG: hypothetical protein ACOYNF_06180 [Rhodoferax sp.]